MVKADCIIFSKATFDGVRATVPGICGDKG